VTFAIRAMTAEDFAAIQAIENSAGQLFREIGMTEIADDEPPSFEVLAGHAAGGHAWVLVDENDHPIGYLLVDIVDGCAHVEQLSVHPNQHRRGYGLALITHVSEWARAERLSGITLTTFRDVPWNAPYYERCGFRQLAEDELTAGLAEIRARHSSLTTVFQNEAASAVFQRSGKSQRNRPNGTRTSCGASPLRVRRPKRHPSPAAAIRKQMAAAT
jgi:GNAT superfamily N-acetyltransferase